MNKEIKEKWIKALRSGEYKQGHGLLCKIEDNEKKYCCLGVLCDLAVKEGIIPESNIRKSHTDRLLFEGEEYIIKNKMKVWEWAEFKSENDKNHPGLIDHVAFMNDDFKSFKVIADYIENEF